MITRENFADLIRTIDPKALAEEMGKDNDFILMEAHFLNVGGFATVESIDYSNELEEEAFSTGNLFCSKEDFIRLLEETHILEY